MSLLPTFDSLMFTLTSNTKSILHCHLTEGNQAFPRLQYERQDEVTDKLAKQTVQFLAAYCRVRIGMDGVRCLVILNCEISVRRWIRKWPKPLLLCRRRDTGNFNFDLQARSYFTINIPVLRKLPFTQAKVIDASWDLAVGRSGQTLAGMTAYRVLRDSVKFLMEEHALPIPTVTSILTQQRIQLATIWELFRVFSFRPKRDIEPSKVWQRKIRPRVFLWIFVSSYVLSFATIASVMTGYFTELEGFYGSLRNNEPMSTLSSFSRAGIVIFDSERLGYPAGSTLGVTGSWDDPLYQVFADYWQTCLTPPGLLFHEQGYDWSWNFSAADGGRVSTSPDVPSNHYWVGLSGNCTSYLPPGSTSRDGIRSNITIGSQTFSLDAPPLEMAASRPFSVADPVLHRAEYIFMNETSWSDDFWVRNASSTRFTYDDIRSSGSCIPHNEYSWGFSVQLSMTFVAYTIVFGAALLMLRHDVYSCGRWCRLSQSYTIYSDILAIVACLEALFGPEVDAITLKLLKKKISKHRGGLCLQRNGVPLPSQVKQQHEALLQAAGDGHWKARKELETLVAEYNLQSFGSERSPTHDEETPSPNVDTQHSSGENPDTPNGYALALLPKPSGGNVAQHTTATGLEVPDGLVLTLSPKSTEGDVARH